MKKTLLLTLILLVSAAWVAAQTSQSASPSSPRSTQGYPSGSSSGQMGSQSSQYPSSQSSSGMSNTAKETHIEGCLSGSPGNYTLTDSSGMTWRLEGDSSDLGKHIGQEVRISGSSSSAGMGSSASSGAGTAQQTFNATKVKKVGNTCSTSGSANPSSKHSKY